MEEIKKMGETLITFGVLPLPINNKDILCKAQCYITEKRYNPGFVFHSGDYYLEVIIEELSDYDIFSFSVRPSEEIEYRNKYRKVYVRIIEPN